MEKGDKEDSPLISQLASPKAYLVVMYWVPWPEVYSETHRLLGRETMTKLKILIGI